MNQTITLGTGQYTGFNHLTIQRAIDFLARSGGGDVVFPAGIYELRNAVRARSGVNLIGQNGAILRMAPTTTTNVLDFVGYGFHEFRVANPENFQIGDGAFLEDQNSPGFYSTVGTVVDRRGDTIFLDRMFNHDYLPHAGATASRAHSIIEVHTVENVTIRGMTLDGNLAHTRTTNGCRTGAVFVIQSKKITLENLNVTAFNGDAISFQQCTKVAVHGCEISGCKGGGLHPGSGSFDYILENNYVHNNGSTGIFYCLRTTHSVCKNNRVIDNGGDGISIGERDTDHQIHHNTVRGNGLRGVDFRQPLARGGDRVHLFANDIGPNNQKTPGPEILVPSGLEDVILSENRITTLSNHKAFRVDADCRRITIAQNQVNGRVQQNTDFQVDSTTIGSDVAGHAAQVKKLFDQNSNGHHLGWGLASKAL